VHQRLKEDWSNKPYHPNLIFRIAVREIEAWLLADRYGFARFAGISQDLVPPDPEITPDPKAMLVNITRRSQVRRVRERIVPQDGSTAPVGPDHNACLSEFAKTTWDVKAAASVARSLSHCVAKLKAFQPVGL
jgi:hypothetical protein